MNSRTRKLFSYYHPHLRWLVADMACAIIVAAAALAIPLCASYITKHILTGAAPNAPVQIYAMGAVMLGLVAIHTACSMFVDYQGHSMGARIESDMRAELMAHLLRLSFGFYDRQKTGQLMTRFSNDLFAISELYHHGAEDVAIAALKLAGVLVILLGINIQLTLVILLILPIMLIYALYFNRRMHFVLRHSRDRIGDINSQVEDTLSGIRVVKSFGNEEIENRKFSHANRRFVDSRRAGYKSEAFFSAGMTAFTHLMIVAVIVIGGVAIARASLNMADLLTFLLCVSILVDPIQRMVNFARLYQEGITGFDRFLEILRVEPDIQDTAHAVELAAVRGNIQFNEVSFKYQEDQAYNLSRISLNIPAGEHVAVVGVSGVGKTTLCSLIPRFYEVTEGHITLDGKDIRDISLRSLRRNIGIVQQDVYLFAGTVADNIGYAKLDASRAEIMEAAKQANAHEFIAALPAGYDTDIGQRGVRLSGGQKQRLSIARLFLKNPPIIILDEATSALDYESEAAIQNSLFELTRNRTTLAIAHRLSTVRHAHRIIVLTDKGVNEDGTHPELIALGGAYARIYNTQFRV